MGVERVNVTALPLNVVHLVRGSVPSCSFRTPLAFVVAGPGNCTGIGFEHVLPVAPTVTPSMWVLSPE